jgi:HJR/Mrr/RecB family endonuclease
MPSPGHVVRAAIDHPGAWSLMAAFVREHVQPYSRSALIELARSITREMNVYPAYVASDVSVILESDAFKRSLLEDRGNALLMKYPAIGTMTAREFEEYVGEYFAALGYSISLTGNGPDQGADIVITRDPDRAVVQVKRYSGPVGNDATQAVVAAIGFYGARRAVVVTNSVFTDAAVSLASKNPVELIDGGKLLSCIRALGTS